MRLKESIVVGAQATVPAVRLALVTHRLGTLLALNGFGRGVRELETEAQRAVALRTACDMPGLGLMLPELLVDLHAVVASSGGDDRVSALEGLMHELGAGWRAVAAFTLTHALLPMGTEAHEHAYQTASDSADQARGLTGHVQGDPALAAYGSLCLVSALAAAVTRRSAEAAERIAEAEEVAVRVGECSPTVATFGPTNVAMYQMKSALEVGDCELAARLGGQIEPHRITSTERQAMYWIDYGRALAQLRGRQQDAVAAFRSGEQCAPLRVRSNVYARETVIDLLGRAQRAAVGRELRGLAYRMGMFA